jgi:hypothetical protein
MRLRRLANRWVIVPGGLALIIVLWIAYVSTHDHGLLEGSVVDATGKPVPGATVLLFERGFVTHQEKARATTDARGHFRFEGQPSHSIQLEAEAPGMGRTDRRVVRLWFAAQDTVLAEPLKFATQR